jgi:hypothetical protein
MDARAADTRLSGSHVRNRFSCLYPVRVAQSRTFFADDEIRQSATRALTELRRPSRGGRLLNPRLSLTGRSTGMSLFRI